MSRYIGLILFCFIIVGCSVKEPKVNLGKKSFEAEDYLILVALDFRKNKKYRDAIKVFKELYEKSHKYSYLLEAVRTSIFIKDPNFTQRLMNYALKEYPNSVELKRIKIGFLMRHKKFEEAEKTALELLELEKSARNLNLIGNVYFAKGAYELALKYFESAYKQAQDSNSLLNIVDILYNYLDKKEDAIALLETHIRMKSCEDLICYKLVEIYGKERNIDGIISTYKRLYKKHKSRQIAEKIVELYMYKKDKKGAIEFLKSSDYDKKKLLEIYLSTQDFKNAFEVAKELFKQSGDIDYLGKMAIYEYEINKNNIDKKILASISNKFEKVIKKLYEPLYLNYYGYLLIDHNIDPQKGIKLVKAALLKEPNSPFYLDSLAWGYYKIKKCKEAYEIMKKLIKDTKEEEILMHYNKIKECLKKGKK